MRWLLILLLTLPCQAWELFPEDDPALKVVDRAYQAVYSEKGGEAHFYAVLYNGEKQSFVDIYKGIPWKRIHRWSVDFQGEKVKVRPRAALEISNDEEANQLHFFWNDYAGYAEAAVRLALTYDRGTGKFRTNWSD